MSSGPLSPAAQRSADKPDQIIEDNGDSSQTSGNSNSNLAQLCVEPVSLSFDALKVGTSLETPSETPLLSHDSHLHLTNETTLNSVQSPTLTSASQHPFQGPGNEVALPGYGSEDGSLTAMCDYETKKSCQSSSSIENVERYGFNRGSKKSGATQSRRGNSENGKSENENGENGKSENENGESGKGENEESESEKSGNEKSESEKCEGEKRECMRSGNASEAVDCESQGHDDLSNGKSNDLTPGDLALPETDQLEGESILHDIDELRVTPTAHSDKDSSSQSIVVPISNHNIDLECPTTEDEITYQTFLQISSADAITDVLSSPEIIFRPSENSEDILSSEKSSLSSSDIEQGSVNGIDSQYKHLLSETSAVEQATSAVGESSIGLIESNSSFNNPSHPVSPGDQTAIFEVSCNIEPPVSQTYDDKGGPSSCEKVSEDFIIKTSVSKYEDIPDFDHCEDNLQSKRSLGEPRFSTGSKRTPNYAIEEGGKVEYNYDKDRSNRNSDQNPKFSDESTRFDLCSVTKGPEFNQNYTESIIVPHEDSLSSTAYQSDIHDTISIDAPLLERSFTDAAHVPSRSLGLSSPQLSSNDGSVVAQLARAKEIIHHLRLSRDAMHSSIDTLKTLVQNERTVTRVVRRQLAIANERIQSNPGHSLQNKIDNLQARLMDTKSQLQSAEQRTDSLNTEVQVLQIRLETKDAEYAHLHDIKGSLVSENRASAAKISDLLNQLEKSEQERCSLATRLLAESSKASKSICEAENLRQKIQTFQSVTAERDEHLEKVRFLEKEIRVRDENCDAMKKTISTMCSEKNSKILALSSELETAQAKISDLEVALSDREACSTRIKKLKHEMNMKNEVIDLQQRKFLKDVSIDSLSKREMRRKLMEVKIARAVIAAKDKHVAEMQNAVSVAEGRINDEIVKHRATEGRCSELNRRLILLENQLTDMHRMRSSSGVSLLENESKEGGLYESSSNLTISCSRTSEAEVCPDLQSGLSHEKREEPLEDKTGIENPESEQLHNMSDVVDQEGFENEENYSASLSSELSDDQARVEKCNYGPIHSLAELEVAANTSPCDGASSSITEGSSIHRDADEKMANSLIHKAEISTSGNDAEEKLHDALTRMASLEDAMERLELERDGRVRECKTLESYIQEKVNPALQEAHERFERKMTECKGIQNEFDAYKEKSEQVQGKLRTDFNQSTDRLNQTILALENTKELLTRSESEASMYADKVATLTNEKEKSLKTIGNLRRDCDHYQKVLVGLREQFVTAESSVSGSQQLASDLKLQVERLEEIVSQEQCRRNTAEQRAARKDGMLYDLERKHDELISQNSVLIEEAQKTSQRLNELHQEVTDLERAIETTSRALHDQALKARKRDDENTRSCLELSQKLDLHGNEMQALQEELACEKEQVRKLSNNLASTTERLKTAENDSSRLRKRVTDSEARYKQKSEAVRLLEHNLVVANTASEQLRASVARTDEELNNLKSSLIEKEQCIEVLRIEKEKIERSLYDVTAQLSTEYSKRESVEIQMTALKGDISHKDANLKTVEALLKEHKSQVEEMRENLRVLETSTYKTNLSLGQNRQEKARLESTVHQLEIDLKEKEKELEVLKSHIDDQETEIYKYKAKEQLLTAKTDELSEANSERLEIERRLGVVSANLEKAEEGLKEREDKIIVLQAELEKANKDLLVERDACTAIDASRKSEREELLNSSRNLKRALEDREVEIESLLTRNRETEDRNRTLGDQVVELSNQLEHMRIQLTTSESELVKVREECEVLQTKIRDLSLSLEERERDIAKMTMNFSNTKPSCSETSDKCDEARKDGDIMISREVFVRKQAAISKLRDWCRHLKKKLNEAENTIHERETNVEALHEIVGRLDDRVRKLKDNLREKNSTIRQMESSHYRSVTKLNSRITYLRSALDEVQEGGAASRNCGFHSGDRSVGDEPEEISQLKAQLKQRELDVNEAHSRNQTLEKYITNYECDAERAERKIEELKTELEKIESIVTQNEWVTRREPDGKLAPEDMLLLELHGVKSELKTAREEIETWRAKSKTWKSTNNLEPYPTTSSLSGETSFWAFDDDLGGQVNPKTKAVVQAEPTKTNLPRNSKVTFAHSMYCTVTFTLRVSHARLGVKTNVYLLGGDASLGQWEKAKKISLFISQEDGNNIVRMCQVVLPATLTTQYKYLADIGNGIIDWEHGSDRELCLNGQAVFEVEDEWRDAE